MRVSLFITCFNDTLFPETGIATVRLLERLGHQVDFPLSQTCCGQMHVNSGYPDEALALVRGFVSCFGGAEVVVSPSSSCVALVRNGYADLAARAGDAGLARAVSDLAPLVYELSDFLANCLGVTDVGAYYPHRVTYHPTCNSLRALALADAPLRLLRAVRGMDLVELPDSRECCGFGGTFAVKNADTSIAMLTDKIGTILQTRAEVCTAADNSCLLHIGGGLSRLRSGVRAVHLAEILASTEEDV
jgi:L-lactate dehydrogenase complex protein LldE